MSLVETKNKVGCLNQILTLILILLHQFQYLSFSTESDISVLEFQHSESLLILAQILLYFVLPPHLGDTALHSFQAATTLCHSSWDLSATPTQDGVGGAIPEGSVTGAFLADGVLFAPDELLGDCQGRL